MVKLLLLWWTSPKALKPLKALLVKALMFKPLKVLNKLLKALMVKPMKALLKPLNKLHPEGGRGIRRRRERGNSTPFPRSMRTMCWNG